MGMVPQSRAIPVLITRPEPQASRFALALKDRYGDHVTPILTPLLSPTFLRTDLPAGPFGSVVLTSETGARAAALLPDLPQRAYCVGDSTADVARQLGFQAHSAAGDADQLLRLLLSRPGHGPFLHLRGREARGDLTARLSAKGIPAQEVVVYAQEPMALSSEAARVLAGNVPVVVPLFSPRSAWLFRRAVETLPQHDRQSAALKIVTLSPAIAAAFADWPRNHLAVAAAPTQAELFLALDHFIFIA